MPFALVTFISIGVFAQPANDFCEDASVILLQENNLWQQLVGTTAEATPQYILGTCGASNSGPAVWYVFVGDTVDLSVSFQVKSDSLLQPSIALFSGDCDTFVTVQCKNGFGREVLIVNQHIDANESLYLVIFDAAGGQGAFSLTYNTTETSDSRCLVTQYLDVVERSGPGLLEGPYQPGDTVRFRYSVTYTSSGNNCQWIQGVVPVFGEGWNPAQSFVNGPGSSPINADLDGDTIPVPGMAVNAMWDWRNDAKYHHPHSSFGIADFDFNGSLDMCDYLYDPDCTNVGLLGGTGGPCWEEGTSGDLLPGGWYAWGIDGLCPVQTDQPAVDYGDGWCCGCEMGPWNFYFDLVVDAAACDSSTRRPLSVEIFTFADGETGSWNGGPSICGMDKPIRFDGVAVCCDSIYRPAHIYGQLFNETGALCLLDSGSPVIPYTLIEARSVATGTQSLTMTDNIGGYQFVLDSGAYWIKPVLDSIISGACPDSILVDVDACSVTTLNLGVNRDDLCPFIEIELFSTPLRLCGDETFFVEALNHGGVSYVNPVYLLQLDSFLTLTASDVPYTSLGNNLYELTGPELFVDVRERIELSVKVSCEAPAQYLHCSSVRLLDAPCFAEDPVDNYCINNRGPYDPNAKYSIPNTSVDTAAIAPNTTIEFEIHFQNTGSDTAFDVVVVDTLSPLLGAETFRLVGSSHPVAVSISQNHILQFTFSNINLPDSTTNLVESQGFFVYEIDQLPNLEPGTFIDNEAAIYFDFNAPVITEPMVHHITCAPEDHVVIAVSDTLCSQDSEIIHGVVFDRDNPSGQILVTGPSATACDTLINVDLLFAYNDTLHVTDSLCANETLFFQGELFDLQHPSDYIVIPGAGSFGCDSVYDVEINFVGPVFIDSVSITLDDGSGSGAIRVTLSGGGLPYLINWSNGSDSTQLDGLSAGDYSVTITDAFGCMYEYSFTIGLSTSTEEPELNEHLRIQPNPVSTNLHYRVDRVQAHTLHLFNASGISVHQEWNPPNDGVIDTRHFTDGIYVLVVITDKGKTLVRKLVVNKH